MTSTVSRIEASQTFERRCLPRSGSVFVNGVRIDEVEPDSFVDALGRFLACGSSHVVHFCSAHPTVEARHDARYRDLLNTGALNVADGVPVGWAARLSGSRTRRLAGSDAFALTASWGVDLGLRHYLYGGTPEALERLSRRLERDHPGIAVVGVESPPFRPLDDADLEGAARRMRDAGAEVVWVGLGAPKQDITAHRLRALDAAPAILCVGAAFDFLAGTVRRAPAWMQRSGVEWVHRLAMEPRRLWRRYLIGNPEFIAGVVTDRLLGSSRRARDG
jgi:N-acetylglucosaminyldiphosphoundecaprenol N-acetyl-beta-D-mannosaminyltransferase